VTRALEWLLRGISRRTFERMKDDLRKAGVRVPAGDTCRLQHRGVVGSLKYLEAERSLWIRISKKPAFVPERAISSLLDRTMRKYTRRSLEAVKSHD
jgi:hypothetical protein